MTKHNIPQQPFTKNDIIVFEGDSTINRRTGPGLTDWAYLRMMNWDRSWCDILAELMFCWHAPLNLTFHNVGVGGSTSQQVLDRFDQQVAPYKPNWLIVTVCGNDITRQIPVEQTHANIRSYVQLAKDQCNAKVMYVGGYLVYPNCMESKVQQQSQREERYSAIRDAADQTGGYYLDIGQLVKTQAEALHQQYEDHNMYCGSNDGHFSHLGNMVVTGAVLRALGYLH